MPESLPQKPPKSHIYSTATKDAVELAMQKMGEAMNFTDGSASVQEKEECGS